MPLPAVILGPAPPVASMALEVGAIAWITATVIVCAAIPLTTGMQKGHVGLGIIGALITIPLSVWPGFGCVSGLAAAVVCSLIIQLIPKFERPLLSQAEIESEMRKMRGY